MKWREKVKKNQNNNSAMIVLAEYKVNTKEFNVYEYISWKTTQVRANEWDKLKAIGGEREREKNTKKLADIKNRINVQIE